MKTLFILLASLLLLTACSKKYDVEVVAVVEHLDGTKAEVTDIVDLETIGNCGCDPVQARQDFFFNPYKHFTISKSDNLWFGSSQQIAVNVKRYAIKSLKPVIQDVYSETQSLF